MIKLINIKLLDNVFKIYFKAKKNLDIENYFFHSKRKGKNTVNFFIIQRRKKYLFYSPNRFIFLVGDKEIKKIEDLISIGKSLINFFLIKKRIIFVHASAIKVKNNGYLFVGPSGSGKTTLLKKINKLKEVEILSDDTAVIYIKKKKIFLISSPFDRKKNIKISQNKQVKVSKIFFLNKSKKNMIREIAFNKAVKKLYQNLIIYEYLKKIKDIYGLKNYGLKNQIKFPNEIFKILDFFKKKEFYQLFLRKDANLNDLKKILTLSRKSL